MVATTLPAPVRTVNSASIVAKKRQIVRIILLRRTMFYL